MYTHTSIYIYVLVRNMYVSPTLESFKSKHGSSQVWSEHDYMSGPQENLRVLQSYEAEYAKRVAFAEEGFRDPKVLAGDLAMANFSFGGLGWIRFFSISVLSLLH